MPNADDIEWFKNEFHVEIAAQIIGTPVSLDMIAALACQETGEIWPTLRAAGLPTEEILKLCVGDTLDDDRGRKAFPKNKTQLINAPFGQEMFDLAHAALVEMSKHISAYRTVASRPNTFCRGFGMFQRDLQFFKTIPDYFLLRKYENFAETLDECMKELKHALIKLNLQAKAKLSDMEAASVAITYNAGRFNPSRGLKQGYFDGRKYYGESYFDYLRLAHTVALEGDTPLIASPLQGQAIMPPFVEPATAVAFLRVDTQIGPLNLRSTPAVSSPSRQNVIASLPDGHPVRAISARASGGFRHVETAVGDALLRGYCFAKFLSPDAIKQRPAQLLGAEAPKDTKIYAAIMPAKQGRTTSRLEDANALSLNEANQPGRTGTTPDDLRAELAAIIDWLAVDNPKFKRYQPRDGYTFCNIYAHDFCALAGAYLPRVWWTSKAIVDIVQGKLIKPLMGNTVDEVRANDLYRWLRDYGTQFGWRHATSLTELQQAANQGGLGIIVARRKQEGKSGHIVIVVPETEEHRARRDGDGDVTNPLQSQAGARNFCYGMSNQAWWQGEQFAESAWWIHA